MSRLPLLLAVLVVVTGIHASAWAAGQVYCQNVSLRAPGTGCAEVSGKWDPAQKLHFSAGCRECTGGGSDLKCGTQELVMAANLELQDAAYKKVAGSFSKLGSCDFSVDLFRFNGVLVSGKTYHIVASVTGYGDQLLLTFSTSGSSPGSDGGGTTPGSDSGGITPGSDGGGTTPGSDGDGPAPTEDDGGCNCRVSAPVGVHHPLFAAMFVLALLVRHRFLS